jgi:predicted acetyltransferase
MWKICFEDTDAFIDLFFLRKYEHDNTLVYYENDMAVASLQMFPYTITFYGREIPFAYLAGLCTLPEYRNKGYMAQLIRQAHKVLEYREIPLTILIPAQDRLFGFYGKFGYEQVFDKSEKPLYSFGKILQETPDIETAYSFFDLLYRSRDFCVQKSFQNFKDIVEEYKYDGSPEKYDLAGMARIIDDKYLLQLYANKNSSVTISIKVNDKIYALKNGTVEAADDGFDIEVDLRMLCRLLFGYKTDMLGEPLKTLFPLQHPVMNLMLE